MEDYLGELERILQRNAPLTAPPDSIPNNASGSAYYHAALRAYMELM